MNDKYVLTVFYDASCELCESEMQTLKVHDTKQQINLVDCSAQNFDDTTYQAAGVTREAMMQCLHVRDHQGKWIKGVDAFELLYRTLGLSAMANLWGGRFTRAITERAYPFIARHRRGFYWTGIPILFKLWGKYAAHRAYKRSRKCSQGQCSI